MMFFCTTGVIPWKQSVKCGGWSFNWIGENPGDLIILGIPIPLDGDYQISVSLSGNGTFRLHLGNHILSDRLDINTPAIQPQLYYFGMWPIVHGVQKLKIQLISQKSTAGNEQFHFGLYSIKAERVD